MVSGSESQVHHDDHALHRCAARELPERGEALDTAVRAGGSHHAKSAKTGDVGGVQGPPSVRLGSAEFDFLCSPSIPHR